MKPNELRIGNWVKISYFESELDEDMFKFEVCDRGATFIDPIPLTEEWLTKFGFYQEGIEFQMGEHNDRFSGLIKVYYENWVKEWVLDIGAIEWITNFKYVHELQNLIFALTGNELEIK